MALSFKASLGSAPTERAGIAAITLRVCRTRADEAEHA